MLKLHILPAQKNLGKYDGYIQALDNEPEIAQLELKIPQYANGIVSLLETEIKSIDVIN